MSRRLERPTPTFESSARHADKVFVNDSNEGVLMDSINSSNAAAAATVEVNETPAQIITSQIMALVEESKANGSDGHMMAKSWMGQISNAAGLGYTYIGLESELDQARRQVEFARGQFERRTRQVAELKSYLVNAIQNGDMDEETAGEIGDIFGIELMETSTITLTITVEVTHKIGKRDDLDENDLSISIDAGYNGDIDSVDDFEVTNFEVDES